MTAVPDFVTPATLAVALERLRVGQGIVAHRVERLHGGLVNASFRLWTSQGELVLRLCPARERELQVDRNSECAILRVAEDAALAPRVLACMPGQRMLLTRYVPPGPWSREQARSESGIVAMGRWLARLHRLDAPGGCRAVDFAQVLADYLDTLAVRGAADAVLAPLHAVAARAAGTTRRPRRRVLCHNDLHHLNIVGETESPRVVDWEYAGVGDPRLDLAQYALMHHLDEAGLAALLDAYAPGGSAVAPADFDAALELAGAVNAAWEAVARLPDPVVPQAELPG